MVRYRIDKQGDIIPRVEVKNEKTLIYGTSCDIQPNYYETTILFNTGVLIEDYEQYAVVINMAPWTTNMIKYRTYFWMPVHDNPTIAEIVIVFEPYVETHIEFDMKLRTEAFPVDSFSSAPGAEHIRGTVNIPIIDRSSSEFREIRKPKPFILHDHTQPILTMEFVEKTSIQPSLYDLL